MTYEMSVYLLVILTLSFILQVMTFMLYVKFTAQQEVEKLFSDEYYRDIPKNK